MQLDKLAAWASANRVHVETACIVLRLHAWNQDTASGAIAVLRQLGKDPDEFYADMVQRSKTDERLAMMMRLDSYGELKKEFSDDDK